MLTLAILYLASTSHAGMDQPKLVAGKPPSSWDQKMNYTMLDEAMNVQANCTIPEAHCRDMLTALKDEGSDLKKISESIRAIVCNGDKTRVASQLRVLLVPPKAISGTPLDYAAKLRTTFIDAARNYIKTKYIFDLASTTAESDAYVKSYFTAIRGWNEIEKETYKFAAPPNKVEAQLFLTAAGDLKSIKASIEGTPYATNLENSLGVTTIPGRAFTTIQAADGKDAILTGRIGLTAKSEWYKESDGFELRKFAANEDWQQSTNAGTFYIVGENSWALNGKTYLVLAKGVLLDIEILSRVFTFMLPINVIKTLFNPAKVDLQYFGYEASGEKVKFSPAKALQHRDYLWEKILASQTTVKEAAQDDGTVRFTLEPNLDLFCKYSVPVSGLVTQ